MYSELSWKDSILGIAFLSIIPCVLATIGLHIFDVANIGKHAFSGVAMWGVIFVLAFGAQGICLLIALLWPSTANVYHSVVNYPYSHEAFRTFLNICPQERNGKSLTIRCPEGKWMYVGGIEPSIVVTAFESFLKHYNAGEYNMYEGIGVKMSKEDYESPAYLRKENSHDSLDS